MALYMRFWFPAPPGWLWIVAFSALLIAVNARSVNVFGAIEYWFSTIKVAAIVVFIALAGYMLLRAPAAAGIGFHNYLAYGGLFPHGPWGAWVAVIMAIFSYLSIEMIAVAAGEAAQPEVAIRSAFRSTVVRLILFYLLTLALMLAVIPWTRAGSTQSPFVLVMEISRLPAAPMILSGRAAKWDANRSRARPRWHRLRRTERLRLKARRRSRRSLVRFNPARRRCRSNPAHRRCGTFSALATRRASRRVQPRCRARRAMSDLRPRPRASSGGN